MSLPINDNPQLFDRVQAELNGALEANISWLTKAYPLAERLVMDKDGTEITYPAVRSLGSNDDQYLSMFPDTQLGNYCFIEDDGKEEYPDGTRRVLANTKKSISIIFWFDYRRVYPDDHATRTIENVKYEILDTLRRYPFTVFKARLKDASSLIGDVFTGYDFNAVDNQYNMRPYGMLRVSLDVSFNDGCGAVAAPIVTLPIASYLQSDWDETDTGSISYILNKPASLTGSGLEAIDEGNGTGWRLIGRDPANYGNVGLEAVDFSLSLGASTTLGATGSYSFAIGINSTASAPGSVAFGQITSATGLAGTAFGSETIASGGYSLATGFRNIASGANSFVSGYENTANSDSQTAIGRFSILGIGQTPDGFVSTDELFKIGNGTADLSRSNALLILKNGTITAPSLTPALITTAGNSALITKEYGDANYLGGGLMETVDDYSTLRTTSAALLSDKVIVKNFTYTFNTVSYTTIGGIFYKSTGGETENGATVIVADDATVWKRVFDEKTFIPEWYEVGGYDSKGLDYTDKNVNLGTISDVYYGGIYNDNDRLIHISVVAGENKTIELGSIVTSYEIFKSVLPFKHQTWNFNGVILNRADSPRAEITVGEGTTILAGTTGTLTVDDASLFAVGMEVIPIDKDATYAGRGYAESSIPNPGLPPIITGILGNVITIVVASNNQTIPANSLVMRHNHLFGKQTPDFGNLVINDAHFDGNVLNGGNVWFPADWRFNYTLEAGNQSQNVEINNCSFANTPAENITFGKGVIRNCRYTDLGGSFLHISAATAGIETTGILIDNLTGDGSNSIGNAIMDHSEALITFSANPAWVRFINSNCANGGEDIIGDAVSWTGNLYVSDNYFENFNNIHLTSNGTADAKGENITFNDNNFINCGDFQVQGGATNEFENVVIGNNWFTHTRLNFVNVDGLQFTNNKIHNDNVAYTVSDYGGGITTFKHQFLMSLTKNVIMDGNEFIAPTAFDAECIGGIGWYYTSSHINPLDTDYIISTNVKILNNSVVGYHKGIGEAGSTFRTLDKEFVGWVIASNIVRMIDDGGITTNSYGDGIQGQGGMLVENNIIYEGSVSNSTTIALVLHGIDDNLDGDNERDRLKGCIGTNNIIIGDGTKTRSIYLGAHGNSSQNQYNIICVGNQTPVAPTGSATAISTAYEYNNFINLLPYASTPTVELIDLTDVNTSTPTNKNVLIADGVDWESRQLLESDISDLQSYLLPSDIGITVQGYNLNTVIDATYVATDENYTTAEKAEVAANTLKVTFPEAPIDGSQYVRKDAGWVVNSGGGGATQLNELSDVNTSTPTNRFVLVADGVDFESRLLVEADISDLSHFAPSTLLADYSFTDNSTNWNTAFGWGDHAGLYSLAAHSHLLSAGATDVTATAAEVNLLDLAGLTVGWVLSADSATTASWKAPTGGGGGGDVSAAANISDNALVRGDGGIKGVQESGIIIDDSDFMTNVNLKSFTNDIYADHLHEELRNESGTALTKGDAVYISGYSIGQERALVSLADASSDSTLPCVALVADTTIANNTSGDFIEAGTLSGIDTSAWSVGDDLYISNVGTTGNTLTNTKPTGTDKIQKIAEVLRSHATLGVIEVFGAGRTNDLPNIADGNVWVGNASGVPTETALNLVGLSDVVSATNTNRFALMANGTTGYVGRLLVEADISDLGTYETAFAKNTGFNLVLGTGAGQVAEGNHTHIAANITDFDTEVSNNASVAANTAKVTNANHTGDVTGDTILTIGALKVTDGMLAGSISNTKLTTNPLARANHTGTQLSSTISDLATAVPANEDNDLTASVTWANVPDANITLSSVKQHLQNSKSITIESPTATEDISMFFSNRAITITEIRAVVRGTTPSVTWTIRHGTDRSATGAEAVTSGTTTTSATTGSDVTTFNDATIVADSFVWLETTAQTGTVDELNLTVIYTID